jgi:hypothetical protein
LPSLEIVPDSFIGVEPVDVEEVDASILEFFNTASSKVERSNVEKAENRPP